MRNIARTALLVLMAMAFSACTTNHKITFPEELLFQEESQKRALTVGIYVPQEDKNLPFDQCEKLKGGSMCYHGAAGPLLEPSAQGAFQQQFDQVVLLDSPTDEAARKTDYVVVLSFKELRLATSLNGFVATRKVIVTLREQVFADGKSLSDRELTEVTSCLAYKCEVEGRQAGLSGGEVVLKTLFVPGYIAGISDRYSKIVATAYAASLKSVLLRAAADLRARAAG